MAESFGKKRKHGAQVISVQDPVKYARASGLTNISDTSTGIRRKETRAGFRYIDAKGRPVRSSEELRRMKSLVIPPAWKEVWISPDSHSPLKATGRGSQ